ncbi:hypothetical protein RJ639_031713 [Escallonia herrerae]|uniref:Transposase (putative) gypsy type domain-containing protein n=1 Tax=Escallonia herrerae TaxID=1293975 RepID=A0AA88WXM9_9ASTE|nr:hypothetical protein RJ639_031713 [Escallonia herrerae]
MSETSTSSEENIVVSSSSSSSSKRVPTSGSNVGTSNTQPPQPSTSQPLPPSSSQPSHSFSAKNALEDVKDQAEDKANPKPLYTANEKSSKMSTEDLLKLIREYSLHEGWYARLPSLQEPANYGTKFETGIYEEQMKSGYRLPLHPFALHFFEHYHMAPRQLVPNGWRKLVGLIYLVQTSSYKLDATDFMRVFFKICLSKESPTAQMDFENPGKPTPNNLTKHILSHIKLRGRLSIDEPLSEQQLEWARIIPHKPVPGRALIHPPPAISTESVPLGVLYKLQEEVENHRSEAFLGVLQKAKGKRKEKQPSVELPPAPKKTRVTPPHVSPQIVEGVSIDEGPIFQPRWTLRRDDLGMPDSQISEQHLLHGVLPGDKEVFKNQTHETFACSFAQAMYTVAAEEAQQKRDVIKRAEEATLRAEELSKQEADYLAQIETLERRLECAKRNVAEEVKKARDQGIHDFLAGNAGEEWLKK